MKESYKVFVSMADGVREPIPVFEVSVTYPYGHGDESAARVAHWIRQRFHQSEVDPVSECFFLVDVKEYIDGVERRSVRECDKHAAFLDEFGCPICRDIAAYNLAFKDD